MIFETQQLIVRKLKMDDLQAFHELESNPLVLQYAEGEPKNFQDNKISLNSLIEKYTQKDNDFWIYAIERKSDDEFVGTVALVKDGSDDEIGYRFLQKYWGNGYGFEVVKGLVVYAKSIGLKKLIAYVVDRNVASTRIIKKLNFKIVKKFISEDIELPETKYKLEL